MDRMEMGVPGLDARLGGGLPVGSLALVLGPPGAGKTLLATQVAFHHASQGRPTLLLSALGGGTAKRLAQLSAFTYYNPEVVSHTLWIESLDERVRRDGLEATLREIQAAMVSRKVAVLVLDSLSRLAMLSGDRQGAMRFYHSLGEAGFMLRSTTLATLATHRPEDAVVEQEVADTVLSLSVTTGQPSGVRHLSIVKMRGGQHSLDNVPYETSDRGITVLGG